MKKIGFIILMLIGFQGIIAQEINWISLEDAIEAQKETPKKIIMDMYTTWCGPCKMLDKNTFHNADVVAYINENYYAVKFNAEGNTTVDFDGNTFSNPNFDPNKRGRNSQHQLAAYFRVTAYPTIVFLDETAKFLGPFPGYKTPKQLEIYLKLFDTDDYKKIRTQEDWADYSAKFNYEFQE